MTVSRGWNWMIAGSSGVPMEIESTRTGTSA
jgi:hypothetical protein